MSRVIALCVLAPWVLLCAEKAPSGDVYAVRSSRNATYALEPLLRLRNGRILAPPKLNEGNNCREFPTSPDRAYHVFFGGRSAGTVRDGSRVRADLRLAEHDAALATDATFPLPASGTAKRRAPTAAERDAALLLFRRQFASRGADARSIQKIEIVHLTSTDVNHDGQPDLIGTARIDAPPGRDIRSVLVVAEKTQDSYRIALARYHAGNGETYELEILVDHADLDRDGTDEIITRALGWEWFTYRVYRRRGPGWVRIYEGYGCEGI